MKEVKNISNKDLSIPEVGICKAGETVRVPDSFNNPNFEVAKSGKSAKADESDNAETTPKATSGARKNK